jgi:DNA-binding HxlR family transcriptional regulator
MRRINREPRKGEIYEAYKYRILNSIRKEPRHVYEIENETKILHSSLMDCLQALKNEGWVKQLPDKRYAFFTYTSLEEKVGKVIELLFPFWLYTNISIFDFRDSVIKAVAFLDGKYSIDDEYRNSISKLFIEYLEKLDSKHPEWSKILREKVRNKIKEFIKKAE